MAGFVVGDLFRGAFGDDAPARVAAREGAWCQAGRRIDYPNLSLPVTEQVCRDTVWIFQTLLLATKNDMDDIATAIAKIQRAWA